MILKGQYEYPVMDIVWAEKDVITMSPGEGDDGENWGPIF